MTNREGHSNSLARQLTLLGASSLTVMAGATIAPSLPEIAAHFADVPDVALLSRLVITIPALAIALVAPLAGYIIDRFGRRRMLLGGIAVYALAGSSGLWLDNLGSILVGRAVLGCTIGAVMTTSITLVSDYFVGPARERFMGMQTACMGLGGVVFLGLGGLLAEVHWRGPFAVYLAAALLVPLAMVTIVEPERGGQAGAGHGPVVGLSRALVAYIAGLYALVITVMIAFYLVPVQLPFHLHEMGIESPGLIGLAIALSSLAGASGSFASSRLIRRLGRPTMLATAYGLSAVGYFLVAWAGSYGAVIAAMVVFGAGTGMAWPVYSMWIAERSPPALRGRLFGGMTTSLFLGQFLSPVVAQPIIDRVGLSGVFAAAACLLAVMSLGFAGAAVNLRR